jgi:glycine cleavage system H lipoate-binding protein
MSKNHPLSLKDYLWIVGATVGVIALVPLIAAFGAVMQVGFVLVLPVVLVGATLHAFVSQSELTMNQVQGIDVPEQVRMHPRHSWARKTSSKCVVAGVDDFAQRLVGSVESIEMPEVGARVAAGELIAVLRHGEREIRVRAPIDGTIARINPVLGKDPSIVNRAPYGQGWLVELTPNASTLKASFKTLLGGGSAIRWMRGEVDRLVALTSPPELGHTMADGGEVGSDLSEHLDEATWRKVNEEFFA